MNKQEIANELNVPIQTVNNVLFGRKVQIDNVIKSRIEQLSKKSDKEV